MQEYIRFTNDNLNKELLFINSTEDLYFLYNTIYDEMTQKYGEKFSVLVDLFLRNGFSYNRFVNIEFDSREKYKLTLVNQRDIPEDLKKEIRKYLKDNLDILDNSVLSKQTKSFIIRF